MLSNYRGSKRAKPINLQGVIKVFKRVLLIMFVASALFFIAFGENMVRSEEPDQITIPDELPGEVQSLIEAAKNDFAAQTFEYEGVLYLLVTYGEKTTGGYTVEITDISEGEGKLVVTVKFCEPAADDFVIQALTYPYDLAMLENPGLPVEFRATGAETDVPVK